MFPSKFGRCYLDHLLISMFAQTGGGGGGGGGGLPKPNHESASDWQQ